MRALIALNEMRSEAEEQLANGSCKVFVYSPPANGEANAAVAEILARHFKVAKSDVRIVSGERSRNKIVEVEGLGNG